MEWDNPKLSIVYAVQPETLKFSVQHETFIMEQLEFLSMGNRYSHYGTVSAFQFFFGKPKLSIKNNPQLLVQGYYESIHR